MPSLSIIREEEREGFITLSSSSPSNEMITRNVCNSSIDRVDDDGSDNFLIW